MIVVSTMHIRGAVCHKLFASHDTFYRRIVHPSRIERCVAVQIPRKTDRVEPVNRKTSLHRMMGCGSKSTPHHGPPDRLGPSLPKVGGLQWLQTGICPDCTIVSVKDTSKGVSPNRRSPYRKTRSYRNRRGSTLYRVRIYCSLILIGMGLLAVLSGSGTPPLPGRLERGWVRAGEMTPQRLAGRT